MSDLQKFWLTTVTLGVITASLSIFGMQYALKATLTQEAESRGLDWAYHIENQLRDLPNMTLSDGTLDPTVLPEVDDFIGILDNVFDVGYIYQIDYINLVCLCDISLNGQDLDPGKPRAPQSHVGHDHDGHSHEGHDHGAPSEQKKTIPKQFFKHVLSGNSFHPPIASETTKPGKVPIDRDLVDHVAQLGSDAIYIRDIHSETHPDTFAEVFHTVQSGGETAYLMRVLVDLDEQAARYWNFMLIASAVSFLILLITIGYPARNYIRSIKQRQTADNRASFLANHDVLTNLHNRNNFQETVSDFLWACHEKKQSALIFLFDLNNFKEVNDYYGHHVGDKLLCKFADLLKNHVPEDGYIARLGGDEFVVLIGGITETDIDYRDYLNLPAAISMPIDRGAQTVTAGIAGGVVRFPQDAQTTSELMQMADLALYAAKPNRAGEIRNYVPQMKDDFYSRLDLREEFRDALEASQLEPYYQPVVCIATGRIEGLEALARWNHPQKGVLTPFVFEEIFDDNELSTLLGQQMFEKIANDMETWQAAKVPFRRVGLNIVNGDLKRENFAQSILDGLSIRGLKPSNLVIEVTENCLFGSDKQGFLTHLTMLKQAGCFIALDDFGTGYSSITQLKELPVTAVKIDKSFVEDILNNEDDRSIINALSNLGKSMDFVLVLEGVETLDQLEYLQSMGFAMAQGYYFSKPVRAAEVPALIERQNAAFNKSISRKRNRG